MVGVILDDRVERLLVLLRPADGDDHARVGDDRPDADLLAEVEHRPVLRDGQPATGRKREREVRSSTSWNRSRDRNPAGGPHQ